MTVKQLMKRLLEAPEDMEVMIMTMNDGVFAFQPPCPDETDIIELGPPPKIIGGVITDEVGEDDGQTGKKIFCIAPHTHDHNNDSTPLN